jgi:hypothetical protein
MNLKKACFTAVIVFGFAPVGTPAFAGCICTNPTSESHSCQFSWYTCEQSGGSCTGGCIYNKNKRRAKRKSTSSELTTPIRISNFEFK